MGLNTGYMFCKAQNLGVRGAQKLGLEKTTGGCLVHHQSQECISYPCSASDMFSNLFFETCPAMDFCHSYPLAGVT